MATTDNRTEINDCNSTTGWAGTDSPTLVTGTGLFYESTGSVSTQYSNTAAEQMTSTEDTLNTGLYTVDWSNSSVYNITKTNLNDTLTNQGGMIVVGDGTDLIGFAVFGSDELGVILDTFFYGTKVDLSNIDSTLTGLGAPTSNAYSGSLAALTLTAIDRVGWGANHLAKANGPSDNVYMDIFRYITNKGPDNHRPVLTITGETAGTPESMTGIVADDVTNGLGVVSNIGGTVFQIGCPIQWGDTGSGDHYFESSDEVWLLLGRFMGRKHFDFVTEFGSSGTNRFNLTRTTLLGLGTRSNWDLRCRNAGTSDEMELQTVTFSDLGQIWAGTQQAGVRFFADCTFNNCDAFCPETIDIDRCTFNGSNDKFGALHLGNSLMSTASILSFTAGGVNGPAICAHRARTYDADNWTFTGYSANGPQSFNTETEVDGTNDEIDITSHPYATEDPVVSVPDFTTPNLPEDIGLPFAFFDDFNRANGSLEAATAWTNTAGSACQISSNTVTGTTGAAASHLNSTVLDNASHVIEASVTQRPTGLAAGMRLTVRASAAGDYYAFEIRDTGGWLLTRVGTGAATLVDGTSASSIDNEIGVGDRVRVEVEDNGNSDPEIRVYVNGRFLVYAVDTAASPFATGSCGFSFDANGGGTFDNVVIEDLDNVVYVRSVTANSISLHPTAADAAANTNKINLTASAALAGETHRLNSANAAFHNQSGGSITYGVLNNGDTPSVWNGPGASTTVNNNVTVETNGMTEGAAVKVVADETVGTITAGDVLDERLADVNGEATFSINYEAAFGTGLDVIVRAAQNGLPNAAVADDGGVQTDETTESNSTTSGDMTLTPNTTQALNDAYYFGHSEQFTNGPNGTIRLKLELTTAHGAGNPTIVWEFWNGLAWSALTFTDADPNANWTSTGEFIYEWNAEGSWSTTTVNSQGPFYYVRARVSVAGTSTNGARGRFCTLDVTKYFRQDLRRVIESTGLVTTVPWNVNTLAKFDPLND